MNSEEVKHRNIIAKHEENIRKWQRMINEAHSAIKHNKEKIFNLQGKSYYVYFVFVEGTLRYIGKGKKDRYKHPISGTSSCAELNRDHFAGKCIEVRLGARNLTDAEVLLKEGEYLYSFNGDDTLYNKDIPKELGKYQIFWDCCDSVVYHKLSSHCCANKEDYDRVAPQEVDWVYD